MRDDDKERQAFLERIARSNCELTEWEAQFVDKMLSENELVEKGNFSIRQQANIDQMRKRYEHQL